MLVSLADLHVRVRVQVHACVYACLCSWCDVAFRGMTCRGVAWRGMHAYCSSMAKVARHLMWSRHIFSASCTHACTPNSHPYMHDTCKTPNARSICVHACVRICMHALVRAHVHRCPCAGARACLQYKLACSQEPHQVCIIFELGSCLHIPYLHTLMIRESKERGTCAAHSCRDSDATVRTDTRKGMCIDMDTAWHSCTIALHRHGYGVA